MNYLQYATQFSELFANLSARDEIALKQLAQPLYDYAAEHDDLPKEFEAMLNGLAQATGDII